jgi:flap endonuclease-1
MGVDLTPIVPRRVVTLRALRGRTFAVDANNTIYQFLALIRGPDGRPFTDGEGRVTSHLMGLMFRSTRLIHEHDMRLIFVFDGPPPALKAREVERRRELKARAEGAYRRALAAGDLSAAWSKAVMTSRFTAEVRTDAERLLDLLGIPWMEAPSEAEAQTAFINARGDAWAAHSKDYDTLLFGAPRMVRYLTFTGREVLPRQRTFRELKPEVMELEALLRAVGLTREQLIDAAILMGTDFNEGVRGIGPRKAVKLLRQYGSIEAIPGDLQGLPGELRAIREFFLHPPVREDYPKDPRPVDARGLLSFLCGERGFSRERVDVVIERMERAAARTSSTLDRWT